jgi:hypothetical protein
MTDERGHVRGTQGLSLLFPETCSSFPWDSSSVVRASTITLLECCRHPVGESVFRSMKSAITSCAASTMCPPLAVLQPADSAAWRNGVTPCPAITSLTNIDDVSRAASTGSGSSSSMPMGVALHTRSQPVGSGGPALTRPWPRPKSRSMSVATRDWSASWMMSSPTPSLKQGDRDRAACAAGPDEQYPRSLRLSSMVLLRLHEGESVEHVAVPGPVRIAADDAHDSEHLGALRAGGVVGEGGEFVRHGDEDALDVPRGRETRHDGVEVIGRHLHRHADAVVVALFERAGQTHRRLNVLDGVTDDREQPA